METKLIEKGTGRWCVHCVEGDVHIARLYYKGSGDWRCEVAHNAEDGIEEQVEWALVAKNLDEAHAAAVVKATENGVIPKLLKFKEEFGGKLPTEDELETSEAKKPLTPTRVFESLFGYTLETFTGHANIVNGVEIMIRMLADALVVSTLNNVAEDKAVEALKLLHQDIDARFKRHRAQKAAYEKERAEGTNAMVAQLRAMGLMVDEDDSAEEASPAPH